MTTSVDRLALRIKALEKGLRSATSTPQLAYSSIEDGAIDAYDADGTQTMAIGQQFDGTTTAASLNGPVPPTPSAPVVVPVEGGLVIRWDGTFEGGAIVPMDFSRVEIHAGPDGVGFDPVTADNLRQTLETPRGGEVFVVLDTVPHFVALVTRTQSGKASPSSLQVTATPLPMASGGASSDGQPPASSPAVTLAPLGLTSLLAEWEPVTNADLVWYDVYLQDELVASTVSTSAVLGRTADDLPLAKGTVYTAYVIARDADGSAAAGTADTATINLITKADLEQQISDELEAASADAAAAQTAASDAATAASAAQTKADQALADAQAASLAAQTAQNVADNAIRTYYVEDAPTGLNDTTDLGDLWYKESTGQAYRWGGSLGGGWSLIQDNQIAVALQAAADAQADADAAATLAQQAFDDAADAATAAGQAQTAANGKNRVWYQDAEPAGTGHTVNDTWFDTDAGNRPSKWTGSAWVPSPWGDAAIGNLDAAKITTGFLDVANRIEAGSMGVDKLDAEVILANDIYASDAYLGTISADHITAGDLWASLAVVGGLSVGTGISITPESGIEIDTPLGVTQFPSDGSTAKFSGDVTAQSITVQGNLSIRGSTNEISRNAKVTVATGVTAPGASPQVFGTYYSSPIAQGYNPRGWAYSSTLDRWYNTESLFGGVVACYYISGDGSFQLDLAAGAGMSITGPGNVEVQNALGGIAILGTTAYILVQTNELYPGTYNGRMWIYKYTMAQNSWTYVTRWEYRPGATTMAGQSPFRACIGLKGANPIVAQCSSGGWLHMSEYEPDGTFLSDTPVPTGAMYQLSTDILTLNYGAFDFGQNVYIFTTKAQPTKGYVMNASLSARLTTTLGFDPVASDPWGVAWDGSRFWVRHSTQVITLTSMPSGVYQATNTWRRADGIAPDFASAESKASPVGSATLAARRVLGVRSGSSIPVDAEDPTSANATTFYVKAPGASTFARQPPPVVGQDLDYYGAIDTTGGTAPAVSTFVNGIPGSLNSATVEVGGDFFWRLSGDGTGKLGRLIVSTTGATTLGQLVVTPSGATSLGDIEVSSTGFLTMPNKIQAGMKTVVISVANTDYTVNVTFPTPFTTVPIVVVSSDTPYKSTGDMKIATQSITKTGFQIVARRGNLVNIDVNWVAVAP